MVLEEIVHDFSTASIAFSKDTTLFKSDSLSDLSVYAVDIVVISNNIIIATRPIIANSHISILTHVFLLGIVYIEQYKFTKKLSK